MKSINRFKTSAEYEAAFPTLPEISLNYVDEVGELGFAKNNFVTFIAEEDNSTIGLYKSSLNLQYSFDRTTWEYMSTHTTITLTKVGERVYIRGKGEKNSNCNFKMTGKIAAKGNCNTLWNYENPNAPLLDGCGYEMFKNCKSLTTAPSLPATELAITCYFGMFYGCTNLTKAPELPATKLANWCYYGMFQRCTSLTQAPELPATELANLCYHYMFEGCTSLTTAPELPATTLADSCYDGMFNDCASLTTIPSILPATTLAESCYCEMFFGCTSLTTVPELPATELAKKCYYNMFGYCSSLINAPFLPATTLAESCYDYMFNMCANLNNVTCLADDISASNCTRNWLNGVPSAGTFTKAAGFDGWSEGASGIPSGWTIQDYVE